MLRYCSIDLETTGLDPNTCQVLELAAVVECDDWKTPVEALPHLHLIVRHDLVVGEPGGLAMNARLLEEVALRLRERAVTGRQPPMVRADRLAAHLLGFLAEHFPAGERVTLCGKNAAGFDLPFLERLPGWDGSRFRRRVLDPGSLWLDPAADRALPDTPTCLARAGLASGRPHHALDDARAVVGMVREHFAARAAERGAA